MASNPIQILGASRHPKHTAAEWERSTYIPLDGEFIVYSADETHTHDRFKCGDGYAYAKDLPFMSIENLDGVDLSDVVAAKVAHKLTFGAGEVYTFDGSQDVTVPVYLGQVNA